MYMVHILYSYFFYKYFHFCFEWVFKKFPREIVEYKQNMGLFMGGTA